MHLQVSKWVKTTSLLFFTKPQLSENIGACARAIKNFNFKKLILVNPKPIYPNDKILATSVGAKDIIKQSKKYENLEKAISNIDIVIATSARFRNKNIKHINLEDLKKINFFKGLGSYFDKTQRIKNLGSLISDELMISKEKIEVAASICKVDLKSDLVGEFPELQGTMLKYLAKLNGFSKDMQFAFEDQYKPVGLNISISIKINDIPIWPRLSPNKSPPTDSVIPIIKPPTRAPTTLPIPPRTTMVKATKTKMLPV